MRGVIACSTESLVDVQRIRAHVDELQRRAAQQEGVRRRDERVRGQDHFVARPDVAQQRGHLQRRRARRRQQDARGSEATLHQLLALARERTVAARVAAGQAARDQFGLVAHEERLIEGDAIAHADDHCKVTDGAGKRNPSATYKLKTGTLSEEMLVLTVCAPSP